jgi:hypothetical protein
MRSLCNSCSHVRIVVSGTGSQFLLCRLSQTDKRYAKYPPQPVIDCDGFECRKEHGGTGPDRQVND